MTVSKSIAVATILLGLAPAPLAAETVVPVARFNAVSLEGGGRVTLRHGRTQRVTIIRGSSEVSRIAVGEGDSLTIRACARRCPRDYRLEVVIETPDVAALAVTGGGTINVAAGFPRRTHFAASVRGGGVIDARALRTDSSAAAVHGGGTLMVNVETSLAASVNGGGLVRYWGDPVVASSIRGGGAITKGR